MRLIRKGETARVALRWVTAFNFTYAVFYVGKEEVKVPHNTRLKANINNTELVFTHAEVIDPNKEAMVHAIYLGLYKPLEYYSQGIGAKISEATALWVPSGI
jgi:hypothetical protein